MAKIQIVSSYLMTFLNILIAWFIVPPFIIWGFTDTKIAQHFLTHTNPIETPGGWVYLNEVVWTPLSKSIFFGSAVLAIIPILYGLVVLKAIFRNYRLGEIFTTENARHYRTIGVLFFVNALAIKPLTQMLDVLAVTLSNPPGQRCLRIMFGTPNLENLFYGFVILVISWAMLEASKLQEDQKLVI